jgi:hypothetical protein
MAIGAKVAPFALQYAVFRTIITWKIAATLVAASIAAPEP